MVDMSFPFVPSRIGEVGQGADELLGGRNPANGMMLVGMGRRLRARFSVRLGACRDRQCLRLSWGKFF